LRAEDRLKKAIERLKALYGPLSPPGDVSDPFKVLIRTILSQNTSYKNELKAFRALEEQVGIEPERLASAPEEDIARCIRPAGQHRQRAKRIKEVAKLVLERYGGNLWGLLRNKPVLEAREELMSLPGVGKKTADIVLLFCARKPVFPVDRHILRIASRMGLLGPRVDYDAVSELAIRALKPGDYLFAHLALIRLGREICRPRKPLCQACPIRDLCDMGSGAQRVGQMAYAPAKPIRSGQPLR